MGNIIYLVQYFLLGIIEFAIFKWLFHILGLRDYKWKTLLTLTVIILHILTVSIINNLLSTDPNALAFDTNSNTVGGIAMAVETLIFFLVTSFILKSKKILSQSRLKILLVIFVFSILSSAIFYITHLILFFLTLSLFFLLGSR